MLLKHMAKKFKTAQIITHNDLDGYGAGAILVKALTHIGFDIDDIKVTNTDYSNPLPFDDNYNLFFISDISVSNTETMKKLQKYAKSSDNLVIWFDHHKTSIDMEEFMSGDRILGVRNVNGCGALLCWIFYQLIIEYSKSQYSTIEEVLNLFSSMDNTIKAITENPNKGISIFLPEKNKFIYLPILPEAIYITDDYDRFELKNPDSKYFMEAFNSYPKFIRDCKSDYFQNSYMFSVDRSYRHDDKVHWVTFKDPEFTEYIKYGKTQFLWKRIMMLNNIKSSGFIASFPIEGMDNIKMICINSTNKGSLMFGKCLGDNSSNLVQYNFGCIYYHKNNKFSVSIYCANPIEVSPEKRRINEICDATDICKRFNGGGHPGAAGFVTDTLEFCDISPLPAALKSQIDDEIMELIEEVGKI